jgi:hypothetical protein
VVLRWWLVLVVMCGGCIRCTSSEGPKLEQVVEAPITIDAILAAARPPEVVADVRDETIHYDRHGGGGCTHAAVCVLALLLDPIIDERDETYRVVTLSQRGVTTYRAIFRDGGFDGAWRRDGDRARFIAILHADSIGRRLLLEVGTAPLNPDGEPGAMTPTSRLAQVDLGPDYLARLIEDQQHHHHDPDSVGERWAKSEVKAELTIGELMRILTPDDATRLARAWQSEPRLNERVKELLRQRLVHQP